MIARFRTATALVAMAALASAGPVMARGVPAPSGDAYPVEQVLSAFRTACGAMSDYSDTIASVTKAGWTDRSEAGIPEMAEFMTFAEDTGRGMIDDAGGTMSQPAIFSNDVAGENLAIVITQVEMAGKRVTGCRLFDPGESRDAGAQGVSTLIGAEPVQLIEREGNTIAKFGGLADGHDSYDYYFIPAGSPLESMLHFNGLAMKIDSVGPSGMSDISND